MNLFAGYAGLLFDGRQEGCSYILVLPGETFKQNDKTQELKNIIL